MVVAGGIDIPPPTGAGAAVGVVDVFA